MKKSKQEPQSITLDEWLDATFKPVQRKPENSFSVQDVIKRTGLKRGAAMRMIKEKVEAGEIKELKCVHDGRQSNFYIPIQK